MLYGISIVILKANFQLLQCTQFTASTESTKLIIYIYIYIYTKDYTIYIYIYIYIGICLHIINTVH